MADRDIVRVRLSGTDIGKLADRIAELYGWTVLDRSAPQRNRRDPGERVCMTVRYGYPLDERKPEMARLLAEAQVAGPEPEREAGRFNDG